MGAGSAARRQFGGYCGLVRREIDGAREIEVAHTPSRGVQGRGIATEVARACMTYAFSQLGEDRII